MNWRSAVAGLRFEPSIPAWSELRTWLRDAFLLLALAIAMTSLDSREAMGTLWLTIPLALIAILLTMLGPRGRLIEWRHFFNINLITLALTARAAASLAGPLPAEGFHEAINLGAILVLGVALWQSAKAEGFRTVAVWTAGLGVGWVALLGGEMAMEHPDNLTAGRFSLGLGLLCGLGIVLLARWRHGTFELPGAKPRPTRTVRFVLLLVGLVLGAYWSVLPVDLPLQEEVLLVAGRHASKELWLQSIAFGWGFYAFEPLAGVLAQPHAAQFHAWGGIWAVLAIGGLAGVGLLIVIVYLLLLRRARHLAPGPHRDPVPDGTVATALLMAGLILGGGPVSSVPLLVFAGWTALGFARPTRETAIAREWQPGPAAATAASVVAATLLTVLLFLPLRGNRLLELARNTQLTARQQELLLREAEALNPFNPAIPLQLASVLRDQMTDATYWSEDLYLRTVAAYRRAERLNPYQTMTSLRLAQLQLLCERADDAIQTVKSAQAKQPHANDLGEWLFITQLRLGRTEEAHLTLSHGLSMAPMNWRWWLRQYQLTQRRGQVVLARQSLGVALTASVAQEEPGQDQLILDAWNTWGGGAGSVPMAPASVELPEMLLPGRE